jgi:hypothetical protein
METQYATLREKIAADKVARLARYNDFNLWLKEAHEAGLAAGNFAATVTMVVVQRENPFDDTSAVTKRWEVPDGPCGFAWVSVRPATSSFAKYVKKEHPNEWNVSSYSGGVRKSVHEFGQSVQRKSAYARAYAAVLNSHGIAAHAYDQLD